MDYNTQYGYGHPTRNTDQARVSGVFRARESLSREWRIRIGRITRDADARSYSAQYGTGKGLWGVECTVANIITQYGNGRNSTRYGYGGNSTRYGYGRNSTQYGYG
eukprot:1152688-Pyramimonas_sp.AAC.1